jgi:MFS family permease
MGATIPVAMLAINRSFHKDAHRSFSYLYLANVLGALVGATLPLLLIEVYGFRGTLQVGAMLNGLLFISAMALALWSSRLRSSKGDNNLTPVETPVRTVRSRSGTRRRPLVLLFLTGFTSMGAEIVWIREFTPYLLTVVYSFAAILGVYLASTFIGSRVYRIWSRTHNQEAAVVWGILGFATVLPMLTASPQFLFGGLSSPIMRLTLGIAPFSGILGFVTPMLVDRWSGGDPDHAGTAYAVNVVGCILGPLAAGFLLLPVVSERWVLFAFALPWLIIAVAPPSAGQVNEVRQAWQRTLSYALTILVVVAVFSTKSYEDQFSHRVVLRDNTATVVATGDGMARRLLVNGIGMTTLTPMTKVMAHLPLASLNHAPQSALVVCFGMGTTYRSLLSWNIPSTAVELVPSVPQLFWYFHSDGPELPGAHLRTI